MPAKSGIQTELFSGFRPKRTGMTLWDDGHSIRWSGDLMGIDMAVVNPIMGLGACPRSVISSRRREILCLQVADFTDFSLHYAPFEMTKEAFSDNPSWVQCDSFFLNALI